MRLNNNALEGPIPPSLHALHHLLYLSLSKNALQGKIPSRLPETLRGLWLQHNQLEGTIPPSLSELNDLQVSTLPLPSLPLPSFHLPSLPLPSRSPFSSPSFSSPSSPSYAFADTRITDPSFLPSFPLFLPSPLLSFSFLSSPLLSFPFLSFPLLSSPFLFFSFHSFFFCSMCGCMEMDWRGGYLRGWRAWARCSSSRWIKRSSMHPIRACCRG